SSSNEDGSPMLIVRRRFAVFLALLVWLPLLVPAAVRAQLVGDPGVPPTSQLDSTKQGSAAQLPAGKKRLSKDFTLHGDSHWTDRNIDLERGEHAVITASGTMRYADAKEANGPEGVGRGFKDLLRSLPFNGAGRGALVGRVGDADIAETFLIGANRDVLAAA